MTSDSRAQILDRIRRALSDAPPAEAQDLPRDYLTAHADTDTDLVDLLATNLTDYRAHVHRVAETDLAATIGRLLADRGARSVLVPSGLPAAWLTRAEEQGVELIPEAAELSHRDLDRIPSVVTTCALAIAETGTIVLDSDTGQGARRSTLIPDHHICVARVPEQLVASVPQALARLDPARPQTWISGPSATSDIELDRVEGVHGPRRLEVVLVTRAAARSQPATKQDLTTP